MRADFTIVLDACVLANYSVCDLLLRLAETPRLYIPKWSATILEETYRTQVTKLKWPEPLAANFKIKINEAFPDAIVPDVEALLSVCHNHAKDKHVLACAIKCQAEVIVTFNTRDFASEALRPWNISAYHPQDYLLVLYAIDPIITLHKIEAIARKRNVSLEDHLIQLGRFVPTFSTKILQDLQST